ncbi:hypothetical protein [Kordiimonas lacus]|uniref:Uncharacterized protein n=1 Tax=Kordiimonas lacus TaxID=637679 RepID=A0A1G6Y025_9PROT|nr:hypothetical protein [Kordiimonas lacus]SDD83670.1 hypothetical protein SAMN04488071_1430 [Kordiimonas lacus]
MTKAIIQGLFILTLIIGVSIAEALMPLAIPETQAVNRFYTPDGMEGTLTGWQECRAAGLRLEKGRSDRQIMGHCTNGYAVAQSAPVRFSDIRTHDEASACAFSLDFDNKPYRRFLSATISNRDKGVYVARVGLKTANPLNLTDKVSNIIDVWLEPGAKQHRCLGIVFRFETEAEAHRFDTAIASAKIELLGVYGVSDKPAELPEQPSKPSFGKLPDATNA